MNVLFLERKDKTLRLVSSDLLSHDNGIKFFFDGEKKLLLGGYHKYDVIVNFNHANPFHNELIKQAKKNGLICILLQDGIFEWNNSFVKNKKSPLYHPVHHDVFFIFGGEKEFKYLKLANPLDLSVFKYIPEYIKRSYRMFNLNDQVEKAKYDFLITTANSAYFNKSEFNRLCFLLNQTIENLTKYNYTYKVRIFDQKILNCLNISGDIVNDVSGDFLSCLSEVSCVLTTKSTLIFEVIGAGKPVGELLYRDTPQFSNPAWVIHSNIEFEETFKSMYMREAIRMNMQNIMNNQHMEISSLDSLNIYVNGISKSDLYKRKLLVLLKLILGK